MPTTRILLGSNKGAFFLDAGDRAGDWALSGPHCDTWPINHMIGHDGKTYAAGGTGWHGIGVWKQDAAGWRCSSEGLAYPEDAPKLETLWSLGRGADGALYAGAKPAGLFVSHDDGDSWSELPALRTHETAEKWMPGGAGLILHTIVCHPTDPGKLWVGISAAGVFATEDGGQTWEPRNIGTRIDFLPEEHRHAPVGQCVHNIARAPGDGDVLYQQNHCGMYRSDNGGREWVSIEDGLPSSFGFPVAADPHDAATVWYMPMNGDTAGRYPPEARATIWRSRDSGATWEAQRKGLPDNAYFTVLRQAMATDRLTPTGVYFATSSGAVFASPDAGETWQEIARHLPVITSVEVTALP